MYLTRKMQIGHRDECDDMTEESGRLWSDITRRFWQVVRKKDIWLSQDDIQRWLCKANSIDGLHSQSAQAVADQFFDSLESWRENRQSSGSRPPHKQKKYNKVVFKSSAITVKGGKLYLSRGLGYDPLIVSWNHGKPKRVELRYNETAGEHELCCQYKAEPKDRTTEDDVAGIDLGEVHIACTHDSQGTLLFNGRELRSKRRYQNKVKGKLSSRIDRKVKGSNRWWKLVQTKNDQLASVRNQIRDLLHKMSRKLVEMLLDRGVSTLVVGKLKGIREGLDYGHRANQKLHQWIHGTFRRMVEYKAKLAGMKVELIDESYTSRTCPECGTVRKSSPNNRNFSCPECGFKYHRDGVGAINIRKKYLGEENPSSSGYGIPLGVRYKPNMSCSSRSRHKTPLGAAA